MQRRKFIQRSIAVTAAASTGLSLTAMQSRKANEYYELRVYEMRRGSMLDNYLSKALIPTLNRLGVKNVGVFTELGKSEPANVYVLIPFASPDAYHTIYNQLKTDTAFATASTEYNQIPVDSAVYWRYESSFMFAFDGLPQMIVPKGGARIFELRTYEGYSEDAVRRKIKMFNEGELEIFNRVKLNSVFFGDVISGRNLPCLAYMVAFKDMDERDANWKAFSADPEWQRISKLPEYANTVSKIHKVFLEPTGYSQV
jgi:hypothetical protein